jgi:hypothetical protein
LQKTIKQNRLILIAIALLSFAISLLAQDARELERERSANARLKGPHPLERLMTGENSRLRPELRGVHPRVYVTDREIETLRQRARTTHRQLWQLALDQVRALKVAPPSPPAEERRAQNEIGIGVAEAALAYKIEGDKKYLDATRRYMDAAVSYDIWGYSYNKPNVDLAAGHLLYGMGWAYDLIYNDLSEADRTRYREAIARHARLMYDYFKPKPGKTYTYSQNHTFIPMAGLGVAAYALYDEVIDAPQWAQLARAVFDRVLATYSLDGYYYEGFEYWIFSTPWIVHYLDAHLHATGEDLYDRPGLREMYSYVAHSMLPTGRYVFDFGDVFEGPLTRAGAGEEYRRTHPGGRFHTNYNILYRIAQRFRSGEAQGVAEWLKSLDQVNAENYWSLLWYDPTVKAIPIKRQPTWHYFEDHDVVYWRSSWEPEATAFAFKCGPPEGHHSAQLLKQFPDWRLSSGHAHPDAGSFIVFGGGQYLTGDSGYAGIPLTAHHNSVLVGGRGQNKEGDGHDAFDGVSYDLLNQIRISQVKVTPSLVLINADAAAAYDPNLGLTKFTRTFRYSPREGFTVSDDLQSRAPQMFTLLLHADKRIKQESQRRFEFDAGDAKLAVEMIEPQRVEAAIEENVLIAPGRPGSVDQGERQVRGERLKLSTPSPSTTARFVVRLRVESLAASRTNADSSKTRRK